MRTAGLPNFRKLYGKIETAIGTEDGAESEYFVLIQNKYDVSKF